MVYKRRRLERETGQIIFARKLGASLIAASFGIGFFLSELRRVRASLSDPLTCAYLALFSLVLILVFLWIWATQKELDILLEWLDPKHYLPPSGLKEPAMILGLGALLVALLYSSRNPFWFGVIFTSYSICVPIATRYLNLQISQAVSGSRERLAEDLRNDALKEAALLYTQGVNEVERYFLKTPQMWRFFLIATSAAIGTILAILWKTGSGDSFGVAAYVILLLTIVVSELVILRWRQRRDQTLYAIRTNLVELTHDGE